MSLEAFQIKLSNKDFKHPIINPPKSNILYTILYYLGCLPSYQCKVLNTPIQNFDGDYTYNVKIETKTYRIFGINIKKVKV